MELLGFSQLLCKLVKLLVYSLIYQLKNNKSTREVSIREIQSEILKSKGYILPYADVESDHPNFLSYQKIGACGNFKI
jgi:hypothetical protein